MSINTINDLGLEIKNAIKKKGLTQTFVAKKMNVPKQTINRIEYRKTFDLAFLQKIKEATGLDYTDFIFNQKKKTYMPLSDISMVEEPKEHYGKSIEMTLSVVVHGNPDEVNKMTDLIMAFKNDASKLGFAFK